MATMPNASSTTAPSAQLTPGQMSSGQLGLPVPPGGQFTRRPDTLGGLGGLLVPEAVIALVPDQETGAAPWEWHGARGKTRAAAHAAIGLRRSGAVDLVAWVDASSRTSLLDGLAVAATGAGLDPSGGAEAAATGFVAWLRATRQRWVIVLDDLRDPADVAGLWPAGPGSTLVTARSPAVVADSSACLVPVPCYSPREAVDALMGWLSTDPDHRSGLLDLALALECEPTAVAQAGAVISTAELSSRQYHEVFLRRKAAIEADCGREVSAAVVTWVMSAEHAEILEPGAGTWPLLVMASLLSPHGIPLAVLASRATCRYLASSGRSELESPARAQAAIAALQAAGLLAVDSSGPLPVARMSVPLQAAVRAVAQQELLEQAIGTAADVLAEFRPGDDPRSAAAMLLRSCAAALRAAAGDALLAGGRHHRVLVATGQSLDGAGLAGPAAAWWRDLACDSARLLGDDHAETLTAASLASAALLASGQAQEAMSWASWAMSRRDAMLGPDHAGTIRVATVLGRALAGVGRHGEAITLLKDTAARSARALGPVHAATLAARQEHASACLAAGRAGDAVSSLRQLVVCLTESLGPDDVATSLAGERLATACLAAGRASEAVGVYEEIVSRRERLLGGGHPDTLRTWALLASAHGAAGQMSAALRQHQQAYTGYQNVLGEGHRHTLACAAALADAYADAGQMTAAMSVLDDAISRAMGDLPTGDPLTARLRQARTTLAAQFTPPATSTRKG
jgi:hypothetical protein